MLQMRSQDNAAHNNNNNKSSKNISSRIQSSSCGANIVLANVSSQGRIRTTLSSSGTQAAAAAVRYPVNHKCTNVLGNPSPNTQNHSVVMHANYSHKPSRRQSIQSNNAAMFTCSFSKSRTQSRKSGFSATTSSTQSSHHSAGCQCPLPHHDCAKLAQEMYEMRTEIQRMRRLLLGREKVKPVPSCSESPVQHRRLQSRSSPDVRSTGTPKKREAPSSGTNGHFAHKA